MRNLHQAKLFFFAAIFGAGLLGASTAWAGESAWGAGDSTGSFAWGDEIPGDPVNEQYDRQIQADGPWSMTDLASEGARRQEADFVPLLEMEQSRSMAAARGIADSSTAGLLDPESSGTPAVVPLPASVWAGLAVLITTVWLGRHPKRRLRLPV